MLENVIRYLKNAGVSFRLASYAAPEPSPSVASVLPAGAMLVDTQLATIADRPAILCGPHGRRIDPGRVSSVIGTLVTDGDPSLLPLDSSHPTEFMPPLGGLVGASLFLDEAVQNATWIVFRVFSASDFVELPYDDFARIEQPRLINFAGGGLLQSHEQAAPPP